MQKLFSFKSFFAVALLQCLYFPSHLTVNTDQTFPNSSFSCPVKTPAVRLTTHHITLTKQIKADICSCRMVWPVADICKQCWYQPIPMLNLCIVAALFVVFPQKKKKTFLNKVWFNLFRCFSGSERTLKLIVVIHSIKHICLNVWLGIIDCTLMLVYRLNHRNTVVMSCTVISIDQVLPVCCQHWLTPKPAEPCLSTAWTKPKNMKIATPLHRFHIFM